MRVITCSNSGPVVYRGKVVPGAPGGLVPMVSALLGETGGHWIYTGSPRQQGEEAVLPADRSVVITLERVAIEDELMAAQRESITMRALLWTYHYLHNTSDEPSFDSTFRRGWLAYREVNNRFAETVVRASRADSDALLLVHDFHLTLVPGMVARVLGPRRAKLAYFHHVPWCEPDYFGILPHPIVVEILESLLACDVVGFHSDRWADSFISCCDRFLEDILVSGRTVTYRGRSTAVTTAPGPIDAVQVDGIMSDPVTASWVERLRSMADGRRTIIRVDRLDLWKNLVRGFQAFELLLERRPQLASDLWFNAIVTVPRLQTDRHKRYQRGCEEAVRRLNERFGGTLEVANLTYPENNENGRSRAIAALSIAEATMVNPTFDGLNLVAKEALVARPSSNIVLSVNAGVFSTLKESVIAVQPFDVMATADGLTEALERGMGDVHDSVLDILRAETGGRWLNALIGEA